MGASNLILAGAVALVLTLALFAAVRSRFVRGRLVFSAWLFLAFLGLELAVTQGYGEQHLKVPTDGPSRENRRASLRRITPLLQGGIAARQ